MQQNYFNYSNNPNDEKIHNLQKSNLINKKSGVIENNYNININNYYSDNIQFNQNMENNNTNNNQNEDASNSFN